MFLNATSGSHFYFDKETEAGESYFYEYVLTFIFYSIIIFQGLLSSMQVGHK